MDLDTRRREQAETLALRFRQALHDPDLAFQVLPQLDHEASLLGIHFLPTLTPLLDDHDCAMQICAAVLTINILRSVSLNAGPAQEWTARAAAVLSAAIITGNVNARFHACSALVGLDSIPTEVIPALELLLEKGNESEQVMAASALTTTDRFPPDRIPILMASLKSRTPDHALVFVAQAVLRLGVRKTDVLPEVRQIIRGSDAEMRLLMAEAVGRLGVAAAPLQDDVAFLATDERERLSVRRYAAKSLGLVSRGSSRWISTLLVLTESANWQLVHGAVDGLHALGEFPVSVIQRLELLLLDHEEPMRGTAAYGLMLAGPKAERAVSAIVARLGHEESIGVCDNLCAALSHIGAAAVLPLVEVLRTGNMRTHSFALGALLNMDNELLPFVTRTLLSDRDALVRGTGIELIRNLGSRSGNAVSILAEMLDAAEDGSSAEQLIMAIAECGVFMRDGAMSLIRRLSTKSDRMAELAGRALMHGGKSLLPFLADSLQDATGVTRERIARIIAAVMSPQTAFAKLNATDRITLETFLIVGGILRGRGPTGSRELESLFREHLETTGRSQTKLKAKARMLLIRIANLEKALGCVLIGRGKNSKGGLTDEGVAWLWLIEEFFK